MSRAEGCDPQRLSETRGRPLSRAILCCLLLSVLGVAAWGPATTTAAADAARWQTVPAPMGCGISDAMPTGSGAVSQDGLVFAYNMHSLSPAGSLKDFSGNGIDGTISGTSVVPSPFGGARRFTTTADLISSRSPANASGPVAVAIWVRFNQIGLHQHVVASTNQFVLWVREDDVVRFGDMFGHYAQTETGAVKTGTWYSIVAVFRGVPGDPVTRDNAAIYIDGVEQEITTDGVWSPLAYSEIMIGLEDHQHVPLVADVAQVLVFRRTLAPTEVAALSAPPPDSAVLSATNRVEGSVSLDWQVPRERLTPAGFVVYRMALDTGETSRADVRVATRVTDDLVKDGVPYRYVVRSVSDTGACSDSNPVTVTPRGTLVPTPPIMYLLIAGATAGTGFTASLAIARSKRRSRRGRGTDARSQTKIARERSGY